ncbi:hypothetical protein [Wolbachia endosymbiont (group B) of Rhopobota naevana]|uniref:hypothetical protein n=1 Tax=Wolbachia endosymbiont (group B) of Rhopobota naevana TaxID=2954054 RepID=UPI002225B903|nr:hypothetical protein [Wolbachia endosymbiont (group B) of Rhopobota naevana]
MQANDQEEIKLLNQNGKAKRLNSAERIAAIGTAIDYCDPKLVQLLLGAKYCMLWQYWLVRAMFNYDMLSLSKMAKCDLPLSIANEQLKCLSEKKSVDVEELNNIQESKKREYYRKAEEFYESDRLLQIKRDEDGEVQLESVTLVESTIKQFAGSSLQSYRDRNEDCTVSDSIAAAVNADFSQECRSMINETINEFKREIHTNSTVSGLTNSLRQKIVELENREKSLSFKIDTVKEGIIKKMQDNKFLDKDFVKFEYDKLLDHYFTSDKYASNKTNPLNRYTESKESIDEAKKSLRESSLDYGFGECIDYAAQELKNESNAEKKEKYLDIVRVLAVNGAHSESLINTFDTIELKEIALQSIFTIAKRAYKVLFDFDKSVEAKLMSNIFGEDGEFANPVSQNVRILESSGSPVIKTVLAKLKKVEQELQEKRKSGKANRETGLFNSLYYSVSDFLNEKIWAKKLEPHSKEQHMQTYKLLYEALETSYLAMATGDDRVLIDYAREIEGKIKKESNKDTAEVYSVLYSLFKDYRVARGREDPAGRWQRLWYHFQDIFRTHQDNVREDRTTRFLRVAMYATEIISEEYEEYQRQRFTTEFRNIDIEFLPSNCLINWLGATHAGVKKSQEERDEKRDKLLDQESQRAEQESQRAEQESQRAEQESQRANKLDLKNKLMKLIRDSIRKLKFDNELRDIVEDNEEDIIEKVVQHVMNNASDPHQVLSAVMEEIRINSDQIVKEGKVSDEIIERSILNQSTVLSNVNLSQGASAGLGR